MHRNPKAAAWRPSLPAVLALIGLLSLEGCFTEVGNAGGEKKLRAEFEIDYARHPSTPKVSSARVATDTARISGFWLSVLEAEYHLAGGGEKYLWKELDSGYAVDFTGQDSGAVLPVRPIDPDSILDFRLFCRMRPHPESLAVPDWSTFSHRGYVKGVYAFGGIEYPFLFSLPPSGILRLRYSKDFQETWRVPDGYRIRIVFHALRWLSGADFRSAEWSRDGRGMPFVIADSSRNAALHAALTTRFLQSFNATSSEFRR
jgi:hypothetical protein